MATAATIGSNRVIRPKRRQKPNLVVIHGDKQLSRDEGAALLLTVSDRFRARQLMRRVERTSQRHEGFPERQSVAIAMLAVEEQIVKAMWTIARQPLGRAAPVASGRCGLEYFHDRSDVHSIYTDAPGGKWDTAAPRPSLPSSKDITQADKVQRWLLLVDDEDLRRILVIGATSKRGDAARRIPWVRLNLPNRMGVTVKTLQRRYDEALRMIANALTLARMG
jgi:hypothetical protein